MTVWKNIVKVPKQFEEISKLILSKIVPYHNTENLYQRKFQDNQIRLQPWRYEANRQSKTVNQKVISLTPDKF